LPLLLCLGIEYQGFHRQLAATRVPLSAKKIVRSQPSSKVKFPHFSVL
jgi:hypothetical protein